MNREFRRKWAAKFKGRHTTDPRVARTFLSQLRNNGQPITEIEGADGNKVLLKDATDEQVLLLARMFCTPLGPARRPDSP